MTSTHQPEHPRQRPHAMDKPAAIVADPLEVKQYAVDVWEFYKAQEPYISRNIQLADAKAGVIALAVIGMFTFLLKEGAIVKSLVTRLIGSHELALSASEIGPLALSMLTIVLLGLSAFFAYFAIVPRVTPIDTDKPEVALNAIVSWPDIAIFKARPQSLYSTAFRNLSKVEIEEQLLSSLHTLALICSRKMRLLRISFFLAGWGFLTAFVYLCVAAGS